MTTESGNDAIDDLNEVDQAATAVQEPSIDEALGNQDESIRIDERETRNDSTSETEERKSNNDEATTTDPGSTATTDNVNQGSDQPQQPQTKEPAMHNPEDDHRSERSFNPKVKYPAMSYQRSPYYANGYSYGPAPYYFYPVAPVNEKPTPLMVIPTQSSAVVANTTVADNTSSNSTTVSPQNLPPRLRQTSASESDSNVQQPSPSQVSTAAPSLPPATNGRRHRSILPRGSCNYYSPHPPPPLMATPPGVLFPYPPTVHQPGHIAYNIRTPDELELLAFQQQLMNLPPSVIWPPPAYPPFPPYSMYGPSPYLYNQSSTMNSNNSLLNPEAAEWVPVSNGTDGPSSDNTILIDDEINFPPLNNHRAEDNTSELKPHVTSSPDTTANNKAGESTAIAPSKTDSGTTHPASSQDDQKHPSSAASKSTTVTYSTVILQAPDVSKSNKSPNTNTKQPQRQPPPLAKDRTTKLQPPAAARNVKDNSSRRRPFPSNRNSNFTPTRNVLPTETPKQQTPLTDDWIEVKSKKTKKFDRSFTDVQYESSMNISPKLRSDEQVHKTLSPPSSLSSIGDQTTATYSPSSSSSSSEENEDDDDDLSGDQLTMAVEYNAMSTDYNQAVVDGIRRRLDKGDRLLILMRGCPGSGKSTLAKSLNHGYNGEILSTDGYFKDNKNLSEYLFDPSKHEDAHFYYNSRLASDAFKRKISPIIIDNTNTRSWEMKPYVFMAKEAGYDILLVEPQTPWRYKAEELAKRNVHNLPLRRIQEMLDLFEYNLTVQSIIDQTTTSAHLPYQSLPIYDPTDTESIDPILTSKKAYEIIDDCNILDDVRLCINDMILFLTSNFYQTSQSLTSLTTTFSDLSLIPSSPTTPSLFHRSLSRLSASTTTSQDHSFTNEHLLRLPTTPFSRCLESLTPVSSTNSTALGKKRRKNKNKQQQHQSDEMLFNSNNNNNNRLINEEDNYSLQSTYNVCLPEDCTEFVVIDEHDKNDCVGNLTEQFHPRQGTSDRDHSSTIPHQQTPITNKKSQLLNIIHDGLTTPLTTTDPRSSTSLHDIAIQCSSDDLKQDISDTDRILIGHLSTQSTVSSPISLPPGYTERGIQVDLNEHNIDSLAHLIEFYSDCVSSDTVKQFYDLCNSDLSWTRTHIDEYLQQIQVQFVIPTLRQLSLNALNQWNEQIKHTNPSFDTISIGDLLQDINDEDTFEDLILDKESSPSSIRSTDSNQITIPWSMVNSLQELYGELPTKSAFSYDGDGISLPLDDELSLNVYHALQRLLGVPNQTSKPVNEKKVTKENKKASKQQPTLPQPNASKKNLNKKNTGPSLQEIMNEELNYLQTQKSAPKRQLDFASQHKLKELERNFPHMSSDVIYDIFLENESDYDLTFVCISSMLDENAIITTTPKSQPSPQPPSPPSLSLSTNTRLTPTPPKSSTGHSLESYEISRRDASNHAVKRKDCFLKADQANRHGMTGVASYYINQAREQSRFIKEANRVACEYLSRTRLNQFRQSHRLDLHELHADEALALFKQVEQELSEGNRRTTAKAVEVITGYGKNSPYGGGYGKIRSVILAYLRQKNYKYSEPNKGAIIVQF